MNTKNLLTDNCNISHSMTSKIMSTYYDEHSSSQCCCELCSSSCLTDVRVKAQNCHLEVNQVLALEYLHVIIRVLFI